MSFIEVSVRLPGSLFLRDFDLLTKDDDLLKEEYMSLSASREERSTHTSSIQDIECILVMVCVCVCGGGGGGDRWLTYR